jgi:hypothetical protein
LPWRSRNGTPLQRQLSISAAQRDVGLGLRVDGQAFFFQVAAQRRIADAAGAVAGAHGVAADLGRIGAVEGAQELDLLPSNRLGIERGGGIHGDEREHLEHVILQHVAQCACAVVVACATLLDADGLRHGDLYELHVIAVPERLENRVVEAKAQEVLHRFLAQVVIDAVELVLSNGAVERRVERSPAREIVTEGLLDDDAPPRLGLALGHGQQLRLRELRHRDSEQIGREGKVEETPGRVPTRQGVKPLGELCERVGAADVARVVVDAGREALEGASRRVGHGVRQLVAEDLVALLRAGHAHHREGSLGASILRDPRQGGHELAAREVAARAEDHDLGRGRHSGGSSQRSG